MFLNDLKRYKTRYWEKNIQTNLKNVEDLQITFFVFGKIGQYAANLEKQQRTKLFRTPLIFANNMSGISFKISMIGFIAKAFKVVL